MKLFGQKEKGNLTFRLIPEYSIWYSLEIYLFIKKKKCFVGLEKGRTFVLNAEEKLVYYRNFRSSSRSSLNRISPLTIWGMSFFDSWKKNILRMTRKPNKDILSVQQVFISVSLSMSFRMLIRMPLINAEFLGFFLKIRRI